MHLLNTMMKQPARSLAFALLLLAWGTHARLLQQAEEKDGKDGLWDFNECPTLLNAREAPPPPPPPVLPPPLASRRSTTSLLSHVLACLPPVFTVQPSGDTVGVQLPVAVAPFPMLLYPAAPPAAPLLPNLSPCPWREAPSAWWPSQPPLQ